MIPGEWLDQAAERLSGRVVKTPLTWDAARQLYLKWENRQITGSFKLRGALNKILSLQSWERERGLVTASAGNHGQGVAWAANQVGARVIVFASDHAVPAKVEAMRDLGAEVRLVDGGYALAEQTAQQYARRTERTWVSPYNDAQVIAGQATIGLELLSGLQDRGDQAWIVPVGGGGLIAGLGAVLQRVRQRPRLIGAQSIASPYFHALFTRGSQLDVEEKESLADGLAGAVEEGSLTIPLVQSLVDEIVLVTEEEIEQAIAFAWSQYKETIEGSAAVALAAALTRKVQARPAVVVISGGNIQPAVHSQIIDRRTEART